MKEFLITKKAVIKIYDKHLEAFLLTAKYKSFTKAAEALYITPSAVIQQINRLEADLSVTLFYRSRHGLQLTEAGILLEKEAEEYVRRGKEICEELQSVEAGDVHIYVGTSLDRKVRLLHELQVRYKQSGKECDIRLVNMDDSAAETENIDLVESVYTEESWRKGWQFLKLCETPLGAAVSKDHPLATAERIRMEDLQNYSVLILKNFMEENRKSFYKQLRQRDIRIGETEKALPSIVWECSCSQEIFLVPMCWQDILYDMRILPCDWEFTLSYGLFYRSNPRLCVRKFLDFSKGADLSLMP